MAKLEKTLHGNFDEWLKKIENGIINGSVSASPEDGADYKTSSSRCSVRVFERYSYSGSNRVSLSVTLFQCDDGIRLCAITSGGSQAIFYKMNTFGEEAFLNKLKQLL